MTVGLNLYGPPTRSRLVTSPANQLRAPFGAGTASGNLKVGEATGSTRRVVYRLVPELTGTLWDVWIETRARSGPNCSPQLADADALETNSYSAGNPNNWLWEVRFHPVNPDGTFDPATNLVPAQQFNPYFQRRKTSQEYGQAATVAALKVPAGVAGMPVTAKVPFAMTIAPANGSPTVDYASVNELYTTDGIEGAQARNETNPNAKDAYYGLYARSALGRADADGSNQAYPATNANTPPFYKHLMTYVMVYSDGRAHGQPYFSAAAQSAPTLAGTLYTQTFKPSVSGVFTDLQAVFFAPDTVTFTVAKNGSDVATCTLTSSCIDATSSPTLLANAGRVQRHKLSSQVPYSPGDTVTVRFTTNVQNAVVRIYANEVHGVLLGMGSSYYASLNGDTSKVMPVTLLPASPPIATGATVHGAPATPAGLSATGQPGSVLLAWTANGESYLDHYNIYRDGSVVATATTNSYADTSMTTGVSHSYRITAVGADGRESAQTGAQSATASTPATIAYSGARGTLIAGGATGSATQIVPVSSAVAQGSRLFVFAGGRNSGAILSGVTDTQGNSYAIVAQKQDASPNSSLGMAVGTMTTALTTSDTVTVTWSGGTIGPARLAELHEFSGMTSTADQILTAPAGTGVTALSLGPTGATGQPTELVVTAWLGNANATTITGTNGYATLGSLMKSSGATSGDRQLGAVYKILSATGAQTATATIDVATSVLGVLGTLKGA